MSEIDRMTQDQQIRTCALSCAVHLAHSLGQALVYRTDDMDNSSDWTQRDAELTNERRRLVEQAAVDRVLRHSAVFARWIEDGQLAGDWDAGLSSILGDHPGPLSPSVTGLAAG